MDYMVPTAFMRGEFPMFNVQSYVPIPKAARLKPVARRKYPFDTMKLREMFFVPGKTKNTLTTHACTVGKQLNKRFETRLTYMHRLDGKWVPCEADAPGAKLGIGVWRTK